MENDERKPFKDFKEFKKDLDFYNATIILLSKMKELCKAIGFIKGFAETMRNTHDYSIIKDGVDMLDYEIDEYDFSDPAFIDFIVEICKYNGGVDCNSTKDQLDFANHLIKAGYDLKKKKKG